MKTTQFLTRFTAAAAADRRRRDHASLTPASRHHQLWGCDVKEKQTSVTEQERDTSVLEVRVYSSIGTTLSTESVFVLTSSFQYAVFGVYVCMTVDLYVAAAATRHIAARVRGLVSGPNG